MSSSSIVYVAAFCAALAPGINSIPNVVKKSEAYLFPIVTEMHAEQVAEFPMKVRYEVIGKKIRDCAPIEVQGYSSQDGVAMKAPLVFKDDPSPGASRPVGLQSFGIWEFLLFDQPSADSVFAIAIHSCGLWELKTKIGPWSIRRKQ